MIINAIKAIVQRMFGRKPTSAQTLAQRVCGPQATATGRTPPAHKPVIHTLPTRRNDKVPHTSQCVGMMREFGAPCTCGADMEHRKKMTITSPSASVHRLPIPSMSSVLTAQAAIEAERIAQAQREEEERKRRADDEAAQRANDLAVAALFSSAATSTPSAPDPAPSYSGGGGSFDGGGSSGDWGSSSSSSCDSGSSSSSCGSD